MLHKPAESCGADHAVAYKKRVGAYMFALYSLVYTGFVVINIVKPVLMEKIVFKGLNLAVVYGFGLIIFALFLALIYNCMCAKEELRCAKAETSVNESGNKKGGK